MWPAVMTEAYNSHKKKGVVLRDIYQVELALNRCKQEGLTS